MSYSSKLTATAFLCLTTASLFAFCGAAKAAEKSGSVGIEKSPFHFGTRKPDPKTARAVNNAVDDYQSILGGKLPIHAQKDLEHPLPADGGTQYYKGEGYAITVLRSLAQVGKIDGYFYGPIITFEGSVVEGNSKELSSIQFYSSDELERLMGQKKNVTK